MSCFVLNAASLESLAASLTVYRVPCGNHAALAWEASAANAEAYAYRYRQAVSPHPLEVVYGTPEEFAAWLAAWASTAEVEREGNERTLATPTHAIGFTRPIVRTREGLAKLLCCLHYQILDAPDRSDARAVGAWLQQIAERLAFAILCETDAYSAAPWGDTVAP